MVGGSYYKEKKIRKEPNGSAACLSKRPLWACFDHHPAAEMTASELLLQ
jgi:hypothetical protein